MGLRALTTQGLDVGTVAPPHLFVTWDGGDKATGALLEPLGVQRWPTATPVSPEEGEERTMAGLAQLLPSLGLRLLTGPTRAWSQLWFLTRLRAVTSARPSAAEQATQGHRAAGTEPWC